MKTVCGIDEAGYGPPLGPLVVSAAIFETTCLDGDAAQAAMAKLTADSPGDARGRLVVCDSKRLCSGPNRLERLERHLMPFAHAAGDAAGLFREASEPSRGAAKAYPWYAAQALALPIGPDGDAMAEDASRLREQLAAAGVVFRGLKYVALHPVEFNAALAQTDNKSLVSFRLVVDLLAHAWEHASRGPVEVWIDKQGGRDKYAKLLAQSFLGAGVRCSTESAKESVYTVRRGDRHMVVRFAQGAEDRHKAVALASMCSKYVREVFMERFNAWWRARVSDLKPTKGYPQDAARFLREIEPYRRREDVSMDLLVRRR